jgi:ATP/maltotriose-dependent transcriptional regulator MalT
VTSAADATPEVFSGPLGEQLHRRLEQAIIGAGNLLESELDSTLNDDLERLRALIAALTERLASAPQAHSAQDHELALKRLHQRFNGRFEALARAQAAVAELREVTSPRVMLARTPVALCTGSTLTRAVLSVVRDGRMIAEAAHFEGDPSGARDVLERLQANPLRLEHPLIETELLRRRRATIVVDAQVHPRVDRRTAELMQWRSYVAAPLLVGPKVIGVIHADRGAGQSLDVLDRDVLWEFSSGLSQAYERASLRRTLRQERERMRQFLEWLDARSGVLTDAQITLAIRQPEPLPASEPLNGPTPPEGRDDRLVFAGLLTGRELDVLRLLADGNSNRAIAGALVISEATVKFHVNRILRKLHVANRAEAVARYLALLGMPSP